MLTVTHTAEKIVVSRNGDDLGLVSLTNNNKKKKPQTACTKIKRSVNYPFWYAPLLAYCCRWDRVNRVVISVEIVRTQVNNAQL